MELEALFNPQAVAIIGATLDTRRPGGAPLYSLTHLGYAGKVYAVNPRYTEIEGRPCYASADALPERCDLAVIAVPATEVPNAIEACGRNGITHAVILSAGFREIGARGGAQLHRHDEFAQPRVRGLRCGVSQTGLARRAGGDDFAERRLCVFDHDVLRRSGHRPRSYGFHRQREQSHDAGFH